MNKYKRLGKNTLLVFIGNAGSKLIGLVMLPFYTSWLSVEDYGVTDIINVYVSFLVSIVSCCIAESIFIFPKGQKVEKQKQYFSSGIVFVLQAFFVSFLLFGTVDFVSSIYGFSNSFTDYLWLIYGLMAATLLQQFFQQFTDDCLWNGWNRIDLAYSYLFIHSDPFEGSCRLCTFSYSGKSFYGRVFFLLFGKLQILFTG